MHHLRENINLRLVFLTLLILVAFGNTLNHGFVWDDHSIIESNPVLQSLGNIPKFFMMEDIADGSTGYYRPMTYISFTLDRAIWGANPVGYNITNLLLHILVALLFYRLVAALFKREELAFAAAIIFALHPITAETVNFHAGGRNTLLSAFFALFSLLLYLKEKRVASVACFTMAIFSKEFALLLPAVFLLYDTTINKEKIRWVWYLPYLAATAGYLALRSSAVASNANLLKSALISENFWIVPQTIIGYLKLMAFPFGVQTMYDVNNQVTWTSFIINTLLVLALVAIAVVFRKRREVLFSVSLFLLFLLPVTNIFPLGTAMMADRYAYFSLFGFALALAYCICLVKKQAAVAVLALLAIVFLAVNVQRNASWKDDVSLFTQMIKDAPLMCVGYQNLGYAYYNNGDLPAAQKYLAAAHTKKDQSVKILTSNALTLLELERPDLALSGLAKGIELEPNNPEPYVIASRINEDLGNAAVAKWHRDRASALVPGIFETLEQRAAGANLKGEDQMARNNLHTAERFFYGALGYNAIYVPAVLNMGTLAAQRGKHVKALHYFKKATRLEPSNPYAHYKLSLTLDALGKKEQAELAMSRFRELDQKARQK